jgi:lipopolysaccharide biosynthesis regulator YciM
VKSLKELALDFDKGGFLDKAIETYKDVLKVNRDQIEVIAALCRIYEDIGDWDQAYKYRTMLSKVGLKNQAETISHILVQKAKGHFDIQNFSACAEELTEAFKFFPSVSGKILQLKLYLALGDLDQSKGLLIEVLKEHPMFASFLFESLSEGLNNGEKNNIYLLNFEKLREFFLFIEDKELLSFPSVVLTRIRLLKEANKVGQAFDILSEWMKKNSENSEALKIEYIKLSISLGKKDEALRETSSLLENFHKSLTKRFCHQCGYNSDSIFWRCPQCHDWETIQFTWKV